VKEERARRLRALDAAKRQALYRANIGRVFQVLVERRQAKSGLLQGFSENYLPLLFAGGSHLIRRVAPVRLVAVENGQPVGILVEDLA
jgi:threonylcarbamoyladenosine tRNA methylthiotransferase MtaB